MKTSFLVPTRNRPAGLRRLLDSLLEKSADIRNVEVIFRVDDDDSLSLPAIAEYSSRLKILTIVGPRSRHLGTYANEALRLSTGDVLGITGDDNAVISPSWDVTVEREFDVFPDKIALVFGNDKSTYGPGPTSFFLHKNWIAATGEFFPEMFFHFCIDTWFQDLANRIGRYVFVPDLIIGHYHPALGNGVDDAVYGEAAPRMKEDNRMCDCQESVDRRAALAEKLTEWIRSHRKAA